MSDDVANAPVVLSANIFHSAAEAIEAIGAADVLGLGVRVANRLVPDEEPDEFVEEWVVEVLSSVPTAEDEE